MAYTKTTWQNSPSILTPVNATNLNHIESGIETNDNRLTRLETYSNTATYIGKYGDKSLWRKVFTETGSNSNTQTLGSLTNVDDILNIVVWVENTLYVKSGFYIGGGNNNFSTCYYDKSSHTIKMECGASYLTFKNGATITTIVEYTRTDI